MLAVLPESGAPVPGMTWNAGQVAAHMVAGVETYLDILRGKGSPYSAMTPQAVAEVNLAELSRVIDRRGPVLAERMGAAWTDLLTVLDDPSLPPTVAWHAGLPTPATSVVALATGDLATHCHDLSGPCRQPWSMDPALADIFLAALTPIMPMVVDPVAAAGVRATYAVKLRGYRTWYLRFHDGELSAGAGWSGRVDCRISVDPGTYLLAAYGRLGRVRPALTGKMLTYGRKPWLAVKLDKLLLSV
jgi:hypothetical protein